MGALPRLAGTIAQALTLSVSATNDQLHIGSRSVAERLEVESIWPSITDWVRPQLPKSVFESWIVPLRPLGVCDGQLSVAAPERSITWVEERFGSLLRTALARVEPSLEIRLVASSPASASRAEAGRSGDGRRRSFPNAGLTFERFVIGEGNRLAHAASLAVAELPTHSYNPLFLFGPTGVGKTHLLHAIANYLREHTAELTTAYTTVESFTSEFVSSLRRGQAQAFKDLYRNVDVLLVDDIHFLEGKEQTQEEFFHTFNELIQRGAQIVLSSDRPPVSLTKLHERLKSRFELGLQIDIKPPDLAARTAIVRKLLAQDQIGSVEDSAIELLAAKVAGNVRALQGALVRCVAYSSLTQQPLTSLVVSQVLSSLYGQNARVPATVESIQQLVAERFSLSPNEICSRSRSKAVTLPRHLAMYLSRESTSLSLPQLARAFNRSDHTTVINASRRVTHLISTDTKVRDLVGELRARVESST